MIDQLIGATCRVVTKDVAYHVWPRPFMKKGETCKCGAIRVKRIRRNGEIVSEPTPQPDTFNVARELDSGDETAAVLEQFRKLEGE